MIRVAPGATFEATVQFASGLLGTVGARIRTSSGSDFLARTTAAIAVDVTVGAHSVYRRSFTAPTDAGQYSLVWDDGTTIQTEELVISSSTADAPAPTGRDLCALADVFRYVPGYEQDDDTDATLQALITSLSLETYKSSGREFTPRASNPDSRVFELDYFDVEERELQVGDLAAVDDDFAVTISDPDGTLLQTLDPGAYVALPRSRDAWEPITALRLPRVALTPDEPAQLAVGRLVTVTGTFGFPEIPADVREAVAKLTIVRYLTDVAAEGTAFTDALDNINLGGLFRSATEALDRYRTPTIG